MKQRSALIALAAAQPLDHFALHHDRAAGVGEALGGVGDHRGPHGGAGAGVERHQFRVAGRQVDLVVVDGDVAHAAGGAARAVGADLIGPDEVAGGAVEGLHLVHRVGQVDDAVVHQRHRLVGPALVHVPGPGQTQGADVGRGDLGKRAVAPRLIGAARHQPVARRGRPQHGVGDRRVALDLAAGVVAARGRRRSGGWQTRAL